MTRSTADAVNKAMTSGGAMKVEEFSAEELATLRRLARKHGGTWPRQMTETDAINLAPTAEEVCPKSDKHKAAEAKVEAARDEIRRLTQLLVEQERNHALGIVETAASMRMADPDFAVKKINAYRAPAREDLGEAEDAFQSALTKLEKFEREYRVKQREVLTRDSRDKSQDEKSLIERAAMILGLD